MANEADDQPAPSFKPVGLSDHIPPLRFDPLFYIRTPSMWNKLAMNVKTQVHQAPVEKR
jgi:hypothetical protein